MKAEATAGGSHPKRLRCKNSFGEGLVPVAVGVPAAVIAVAGGPTNRRTQIGIAREVAVSRRLGGVKEGVVLLVARIAGATLSPDEIASTGGVSREMVMR